MPNLEWSNSYGVYKANVGVLTIVVSYKSDRNIEAGYYVSIVGAGIVSIKTPFQSVEQGRQAGIQLAIRHAQRVLDLLTDSKPGEGE